MKTREWIIKEQVSGQERKVIAAVLGGIGNIPGAVLGGIVLGLAEAFGAGYISSEYQDVFAFVVLVVVLIFRPSGLLGQRTADRA